MEASDCMETYFYVHTLAIATDGRLSLLEPERIAIPGQPATESVTATGDNCVTGPEHS